MNEDFDSLAASILDMRVEHRRQQLALALNNAFERGRLAGHREADAKRIELEKRLAAIEARIGEAG